MAEKNVLEMKGIRKSFPGVEALRDVDFSLRKGEIHAIVGENGAGKSTLMKILAGMYRADAGEITISGKQVVLNSPSTALQYGISMVYQQFVLSPELSSWENIVLGARLPFFLRPKQLQKQIANIIDTYGLQIDLEAKIWQLSVGEQQRVEIIKCFYRGANILILDEPTAVLTPSEVKDLFSMIKRITANGCSVIFISHKIDEVLCIADRISVLRKGFKICEMKAQGCSPQELSCAMIGRNVNLEKPRKIYKERTAALSIRDLRVLNDRKLLALDGVSMTLFSGEILGVAAISGNGQAELAEAITGLRKIKSGSITLSDGQAIQNLSVRSVIRAGIAHISEKRLHRSLIPTFSLAENLVIKNIRQPPFSRKGIIRKARISEYGNSMINLYGIAAPSPDVMVQRLSGGNFQKIVIAREIDSSPQILLAINPTYGLDISAIEFVQDQLLKQRDEGKAILLVSEELEEVLRLSDRVIVLSDGRIVGLFSRGEFDREAIGLLMTRGW